MSQANLIKRPLLAGLAALWAGLLGRRLAESLGPQAAPGPAVLFGLAGLALIAAFILLRFSGPNRFLKTLAVLLPLFLLGGALAARYPLPRPQPGNLLSFQNQRTVIQGRVVGPADERTWGRYLTIETDRLIFPDRDRPVRGRLRLLVTDRAGPLKVRPGDLVRCLTTIRPIEDFANGQALSYRRYLADRGIQARATVSRANRLMVLGPARGGRFSRALAAWRRFNQRLILAAGQGRAAGLLRAVLLGQRQAPDRADRDAFAATGAVHLLVVSGLHLAVIGLITGWACRRLLSLSPRLCLRLNLILVSSAVGLAAMAAYALLAGTSPATWRAFLLAAAALAALSLSRRRDAASGLIAAALAISLLWPPAPFDLGFQMSFTAVAALMWLMWLLAPDRGSAARSGPVPRLGRYLAGLALATLVVNLALAPLLARAFNQLPLGGLVLNLLLVPLFSLVVVPLGLAGLALGHLWAALGKPLLVLAGVAAEWGADLVATAARWPGSHVRVPELNLFEIGLALALLLGLALVLGVWRGRYPRRRLAPGLVLIGLSLIFGLSDVAVYHLDRAGPDLRLIVFDVGPGSAAYVKLPGGRRWLVDGGGLPGSDFDTGRNVLAPALAARKITGLETVALSHAQVDHWRGLPFLIANFNPRSFVYAGSGEALPAPLRRVLARAGLHPADLAAYRRGVNIHGARVQVLWPPAENPPQEANEASLVLKFSRGPDSILLCGDIGRPAETRLAALHDRGLIDLRARVLLAPHHGSGGSSSAAFLSRVRPRVVVVSNGRHNRFGFPAPATMARIKAVGATIYETGRQGAIRVDQNQGRLTVTTVLDGEED